MPRAHFTKAVVRRVSGAPADGTFEVYKADGTVLTQTIYSADTGVTALVNPIPFSNGIIDFFLDTPERVRLVITPSGSTAQNFDNVDVPAPAGPSSKVIRIPHTWHIPGDVKVAAGDVDYVLPMFVAKPAFQTMQIVSVRHRINSGTSATFTIGRDASQVITSGIVATTTDTTTAVAQGVEQTGVGDGGRLYLAVTAVSGLPKNLTVTAFIDYTV